MLLRSPEPQAINKNIIGATQLFNPPNIFPQHPALFATALLQQQGSQQQGSQQHFSQQHLLCFLFDITIPPSY